MCPVEQVLNSTKGILVLWGLVSLCNLSSASWTATHRLLMVKMEMVEFGYVFEGRVYGLPMDRSGVGIAWGDVHSGLGGPRTDLFDDIVNG